MMNSLDGGSLRPHLNSELANAGIVRHEDVAAHAENRLYLFLWWGGGYVDHWCGRGWRGDVDGWRGLCVIAAASSQAAEQIKPEGRTLSSSNGGDEQTDDFPQEIAKPTLLPGRRVQKLRELSRGSPSPLSISD